MEDTRICSKCKQEKTLSEFNRFKAGHQRYCKECNRQYSYAYALKRNPNIQRQVSQRDVPEGFRRCIGCKEIFPEDVFYKARDKAVGRCPKCRHAAYLLRTPGRPRIGPKTSQEGLAPGYKRCQRCKQVKAHSEYYVSKRTTDGVSYICIECENTRCKQWQANNRERMRENAKRWRRENPERFRVYQREYARRKREKKNEQDN